MALTFDTRFRFPTTASSTSTATTFNFGYTCGSAVGALVLIPIWAGTTARTGGDPSYGGSPLTQVRTRVTVTETSIEMWYLLNPCSGSFTLTLPNSGGRTMWVYAASGNSTSASVGYALDSSGSNAATEANPRVSITTVETPTIIFAGVGTGDNTWLPTSRTIGFLSIYDDDIGNYGGGSQYGIKTTAAGVTSASWIDATSDDYNAIAVAFKEVARPFAIVVANATQAQTAGNITLTYTAETPPTTTLGTPNEGYSTTASTVDLKFTGTDSAAHRLDYQVQVSTDNNFGENIQVDQICPAVEGGSGSTLTLTFPTAPAVGSLVTVGVTQWGGGASGITGVVDNQGNTYYRAISGSAAGDILSSIFYAKNVASSGTFIATVNITTTDADTAAGAVSYTGVNKTNPLTGTPNINTGTGTTANSGSTASTGSAVYVGVLGYGLAATNTPVAPWNERYAVDPSSFSPILGEDLIGSGEQTAYFTIGTSAAWIATIAAFSGSSTIINALSTEHTGFSAGASHPTNSGVEQTYTTQTPFAVNTTYYWRVRATDNTTDGTYSGWGGWSGSKSFIIEGAITLTVQNATQSHTNIRLITFIDGLGGDVSTFYDTFVDLNAPDTNYASGLVLTLRNGNPFNGRGLIKFTLTSLIGKTIGSANLYVYKAGSGNCNVTIARVLSVNSTWTETGATWNHTSDTRDWAGSPGCSTPNTDFSSTPIGNFTIADGDPDETEYNVSLNLTEFASLISDNSGILLYSDNADITSRISSSDALSSNLYPKLVVIYLTPLALIQNYSIIIENATQSQTSDNITITFNPYIASLTIQNATHLIDPSGTWIDGESGNVNSQIDTLLYEPAPTTNYATWTTWEMGEDSSSAGHREHEIVKYDVSGIPAGASIVSATLRVWINVVNNAGTLKFYNILAANSGWTETGATWNHAVENTVDWAGSVGCATSGTDYSTDELFSADASGWSQTAFRDLALNTSEVTKWLTANYGFIAIHTPENSVFKVLQFASSDNADTSIRPKLTVVYGQAPLVLTKHDPPLTVQNATHVHLTENGVEFYNREIVDDFNRTSLGSSWTIESGTPLLSGSSISATTTGTTVIKSTKKFSRGVTFALTFGDLNSSSANNCSLRYMVAGDDSAYFVYLSGVNDTQVGISVYKVPNIEIFNAGLITYGSRTSIDVAVKHHINGYIELFVNRGSGWEAIGTGFDTTYVQDGGVKLEWYNGAAVPNIYYDTLIGGNLSIVDLTQHQILAVQNAAQAQTSDNVALTQHQILTVQGATQIELVSELYNERVLSTAPITYWALNETAGTSAINTGTLGTAANGTYISASLARITAPGGTVAPYFNNDYDTLVNVYSTSLRDNFNGNEGTLLVWGKWTGVWNSNFYQDIFNIECAEHNNQLSMTKAGYYVDNNVFEYYWNPAPGDFEYVEIPNFGTDWVCLAMVWSDSGDFFKAYKNGIQQGSTQTGLGVWTETLDVVAIGAAITSGLNGWTGYIAHTALWDEALTETKLRELYNSGVGNLVLTLHNVLTIQNTTQAMTSDRVTLSAHYAIIIANATQAMISDKVTLSTHYAIIVANATQAQTTNNIVINYRGVIITIDYETGDLSQYTTVYDSGGNLAVTANAAIAATNYGMSIHFTGDTTERVGEYRLTTPETSGSLSARFYFDFTETYATTNDGFRILQIRTIEDLGMIAVYFDPRDSGETHRLYITIQGDTGEAHGPIIPILKKPHYFETRWIRASGSATNDGICEIWIDGILQVSYNDIDNYDRFSDFGLTVFGGNSPSANLSGYTYLDELVINNTGQYIGYVDGLLLDRTTHQAQTSDNITLKGHLGILYDINHEDSTLGEYDFYETDGGHMSVVSPGLVNTQYALSCYIPDTNPLYAGVSASSLYMQSGVIRARFYIDFNSLYLVNDTAFTLIALNNSLGLFLFDILVYYESSYGYTLIPEYRYDGSSEQEYVTQLSNAPHWVEFLITRATTSSSFDGNFYFWVDGVLRSSKIGRDNYDTFNSFKNMVWGAVASVDAGDTGTFYLDELIIRDDDTYIGPKNCLIVHPGDSLGQTAENITLKAYNGIIINIDHDDGTLDAYDVKELDGGHLSVTSAAALVNTQYGMQLFINDNNDMYGTVQDLNNNTGTIRARFYLDVNGVSMADPDENSIITAYNSVGSGFATVELSYRNGEGRRIRATVSNDAYDGFWSTPILISDKPHWIEILVKKATTSTSNDGYVTIWVDGKNEQSIVGVDLYDRFDKLDQFLMGMHAIDTGTRGTIYLDELVVRDNNVYIGPADCLIVHPGDSLGQTSDNVTLTQHYGIIVDIDHETGNFSQYDTVENNGGNLSITSGAALGGTGYGMQAFIANTNDEYALTYPLNNTSGIVRARFYIDPNSISVPDSTGIGVISFYNSGSISFGGANLIYYTGVGYTIRASIRKDDTDYAWTTWIPITDTQHYVEVQLVKATGSETNDGSITVWVDGSGSVAATGIDNYTIFDNLNYVLLGANGVGSGITGTYYLDELVVRDDNFEIGPNIYTPTQNSTQSQTSDNVALIQHYKLSNILYNIDFETGDLSQIADYTIDPHGDMTVIAGAALAGTRYGLNLRIQDGDSYEVNKFLTPKQMFRIRYYIDPNSITMPNGGTTGIFALQETHDEWNYIVFNTLYYRTDTGYILRFEFNNDADTTAFTGNYAISDAPHYIEFLAVAATTDSSSDGYYKLWVDSVLAGEVYNVDNYNRIMDGRDGLRVGSFWQDVAGFDGNIFIDEIAIKNETFDLIQNQTAENITLTYNPGGITLTVNNATQAITSDKVVLSAHYAIVVANATQAQTSDNLALTQHQILTVSNATQAQTSENVVLSAHYAIVVANATQAQTSDNVILSAHYAIVVSNATQTQTADKVLLVVHQIIVNNAAQAITSDKVVLSAHYAIVVSNATQAQTSDNIALTQHQVLVVNGSTHAITSDTINLSAHYAIIVSNATQLQTSDNVALTQHYVLVVNASTQTITSDNVVLFAHYAIVVFNSAQTQTSEKVLLVIHQILVNNATQATTSDNVILSAHYAILVANATQAHTSDKVLLVVHQIIVNNSTQATTSDKVTLSAHYAIIVANATQTQTSDNVVLAAHYTLSVNNATQIQISDINTYASDTFSRADGSLGYTESYPYLEWTGATWSISNGSAINTPSASPVSLSNPSFETGNPPDNWTKIGTPTTYERSDTQKQDGNYSIHIVANDNGQGTLQNNVLTIGKYYKTELYLYPVILGDYYNVADNSSGLFIYVPLNQWNKLINISPAIGTYFSLRPYITSESYWDNIVINELDFNEFFATVSSGKSDVTLEAKLTLGSIYSNRAPVGLGMRLDNANNPSNFLYAYIDGYGANNWGRYYLVKVVNNVKTTILSGDMYYSGTSYQAGGILKVTMYGNKIKMYYRGFYLGEATVNNSEIVNNTIHGLYSTDSSNSIDNFLVKDYPGYFVLYAHYGIVVNDSTQLQTAENTILSAHYSLTVNNSTQTQTSDKILLVVHQIIVNNATQVQTSDNVILSAHYGIIVNNSTQVQTSEKVLLVVHQIIVNNSTQLQISDNIILSAHYALTVNNATQTQTSDKISLTQHQILGVNNSTQIQTSDNIVLSAHYAILVNNASQAQTSDNITLTQHQILAINNAIQTHTSENITLTQHQVLTISNSTQLQNSDNINLVQHYILAINSSTQLQTADNITLIYSGYYNIIVNNSTQLQTSDNILLTQHQILGVNDSTQIMTSDKVNLSAHYAIVITNATQTQTSDNIVLTQHQVLGINNSTQTQTSDNLVLSAHYTIIVANVSQAQTSDNVALTQHQVLAVNNTTQAQTSDNVVLSAHYAIVVNNATQAQTSDNVGLTQHQVLSVNDTTHAMTSDKINLSAHYTIAVNNATQAQTSDNVALTQHQVLGVNNATQAMTSDKIVLSAHYAIIVANATQTQTSDNVVLTQHHVLGVNNATQTQTSDNIVLSAHYAIVVNNATQAQTSDNVSLTQHQVLGVNDSTQTQTSENVTLSAHYTITVQDSTQLQISDNVSLSAHYSLTVNDSTQAHTSENVTLSPHNIYALTVNNATQVQTAENINLIAYMYGILTMQSATQGHTAGSVVLTATIPHYVLYIIGSYEALLLEDAGYLLLEDGNKLALEDGIARIILLQTADNVILSAHYVLTNVNNATQTQTADNVALIQHHVLSINNATQSQTSDNIVLFAHYAIVVNNANQSQTSDNVILTQHQVLVVSNASQSQISDNITLLAHYTITVNNASQSQTSDNVILTQHQVLGVNNSTQSQTSDNIVLLAHYAIIIINATQSQTSDNITLTQHQVLGVNNATQSQASDNIVLFAHYAIVVNNATQSQTSDNITLLAHYAIVINNATQAQTSENVVLLAHYSLTINNATQAQIADNVVLLAHYTLTINNATQTQTSENVILSPHNIYALTISDATQNITSTNITLIYQGYYNIILNNSVQGQTSENVSLTQHQVLLVSNATQTQTSDNIILSAHYSINVNNATQSQTSDNVTLAAHYSLIINNATQSQTSDNVALFAHYALTINNVVQGQTSENIVLTQHQVLSIQNSTQAQTSENIALFAHYAITINNATQSQTSDNVVLAAHYTLDVNNATQSQTSNNVTLTAYYIVGANNATQGQTSDNVVLTQHQILAINNAAQAQTSDNVTLTAYMFGVLTIQNATQGQTAENVSLTQHQALSINSVTQGQIAENLVLFAHYALTINNAAQAQTSEQVVLFAHYAIIVQNAAQTQTSENVILYAHYALIVGNATQLQTSENVALTQHQVLSVGNATQLQTSDNITLTQHQVLVIANATQLQTSENVVLTAHIVGLLVVQNATQGQTSDNITLTAYIPNFLLTADLTLSNAGLTSVNGEYIDSGKLNGKEFYKLTTDNDIRVWWNGSVWVVGKYSTSTTYYYSTDNVITPDLIINWIVFIPGGGIAPPPTIFSHFNAVQAQTADNITLTPYAPTYALTINSAVQTQTSDNILLTQNYSLLINNSTQSQTSDNIMLSAHYAILVNNSTQTHVANNVELLAHYSLVVNNSTQTQTSDNTSLTQHYLLSIDNTSQLQTAENVILTAHYVITVNNVTQIQTSDNIILTQHHVLAINNATQVQTADSVILVTHLLGILNVLSSTQAQTSETVNLTQHQVLAINNATQTQTAENAIVVPRFAITTVYNSTHAQTAEQVILTAHYSVLVNNATQTQTSGNVALTQHHVLAINNAAQLQTAPIIGIGSHYLITTVYDCVHAQTAENIILTAHYAVVVNNSTHIQTAENVALTQHHVLAINDATQLHFADNIILSSHYIITTVYDALHLQNADNVIVVFHNVLVVNDAIHAQTADSVILFAHYGLIINNATQLQTADTITTLSHYVLGMVNDATHAQTATLIVLIAALILTNVTTPGYRVFFVEPEDRNIYNDYEDRNLYIDFEDRNYYIEYENRIYDVLSCTDGG